MRIYTLALFIYYGYYVKNPKIQQPRETINNYLQNRVHFCKSYFCILQARCFTEQNPWDPQKIVQTYIIVQSSCILLDSNFHAD